MVAETLQGLVHLGTLSTRTERPGEASAQAVQISLAQVDRLIICVFLEKDEGIYRERLPHYFPVGMCFCFPPGHPRPAHHSPNAPGHLSLSSAFQPEAPTVHPEHDW